MLKNILFVVACLTTTFACADGQANKSTTASEAINHVYDSIYQSFIEGDVSRIGDRFYTKDALFFLRLVANTADNRKLQRYSSVCYLTAYV